MNEELLKDVFNDLKNNNKEVFHTGFKKLDSSLQISQKGAFVLIGGRPAMGKTAFIFSIMLNIMTRQDKILLFSSEYSKEYAIKKLLLLKSEIEFKKYYANKLNKNDLKALENSYDEMKSWNIEFLDDVTLDYCDFEQYLTEQKPKVVFIDDIDSMNLFSGKSSKKHIFCSLQKFAQKNECIIFATTTLTRKPDERDYLDHRPILSDLKEFKYTANTDVVILLYRAAYYGYHKSRIDKSPNSEIIIAKNKYVIPNTGLLEFDSKFVKFYEKESLAVDIEFYDVEV